MHTSVRPLDLLIAEIHTLATRADACAPELAAELRDDAQALEAVDGAPLELLDARALAADLATRATDREALAAVLFDYAAALRRTARLLALGELEARVDVDVDADLVAAPSPVLERARAYAAEPPPDSGVLVVVEVDGPAQPLCPATIGGAA